MYIRRIFFSLALLGLVSCGSASEDVVPPVETEAPVEKPSYEIPMDFGNLSRKAPIYVDTLLIKAYNDRQGSLDLENEMLPAYEEEMNIEIVTRTKFGENERWGEGLIEITNYGFSFKPVTYEDEAGGQWHDTFDMFRFRFETAEQATREFNRQVKGFNAYEKLPLQGQGHESRRILTANEIYFVTGSCRTIWFVRDAANRIIWLSQGKKGIAPKTMIRTFCGGGIQLSREWVVAPEPLRDWEEGDSLEH